MKKQLQLLTLAVLCLFASCSNDETPNTTLAGENGFEVNSTAYITDFIYVTPSNEIVLSSVNLDNGPVEGANIVKFVTSDPNLSEITYNVRESLLECTAIVDATWENGNILPGRRILEEDQVITGFMRIVEIDRILQEIDIIFEFQRSDGQLVAGTYEGNYQIASFE